METGNLTHHFWAAFDPKLCLEISRIPAYIQANSSDIGTPGGYSSMALNRGRLRPQYGIFVIYR